MLKPKKKNQVTIVALFMKIFFATILTLCGLSISCSEEHYTEALSPEEALASFELNKDFDIELLAAEPFVMDPVEMVFDEEGNAFVVELADYPFKPESGIGSGKIRMLMDTSGDGRVDKSIIFADSLLEATSILPWQGGLIVTAAPHIFFLKDTNGDYRADIREMLFTGFSKRNVEYQITNLRFSIDNWIYAANFGQEGNVTSARNPNEPPVSISGGDFRFRIDRGQFEVESGPTQFGQTIDDWGHRFVTDNSIHIQQPVIPWRYLHRHPYLPSTNTTVNISDHDPIIYQISQAPYWRAERTKRRNESYQENKVDREEYADDHFTGACGTTVYTADAFPEKYYGNIFIADVAGNLVHRDVVNLNVDSVGYVAKRDESERSKEFLASADPWFRPVNFTVGPDGFLYVIDMYRQHIEGPDFIPEDLKADMNFSSGSQMGRIYRIVPKNQGTLQKTTPRLKTASGTELVDCLSNPNQWWRLQAQRLLLERQDQSVVPGLKKFLYSFPDARTRLHALYVLEGLNALDAKLIEEAMKDSHPEVRESAVALSERYPECLPQLIKLIHDSSARVALQATLSLGQFSASLVVPALATVMEKYGESRFFAIAVLSSEPGSSLPLLETLVEQGFFSNESKKAERAEFLSDFSYVIGSRKKHGESAQLLRILQTPDMNKAKDLQLAGLIGLADGIEESKNKTKADPLLVQALRNIDVETSNELKETVGRIIKLTEEKSNQ